MKKYRYFLYARNSCYRCLLYRIIDDSMEYYDTWLDQDARILRRNCNSFAWFPAISKMESVKKYGREIKDEELSLLLVDLG